MVRLLVSLVCLAALAVGACVVLSRFTITVTLTPVAQHQTVHAASPFEGH